MGRKEKREVEESPKQVFSGLKRKMESEMVGESQLNTSQFESVEKQKTMKKSLETDSEGNVAEVKDGKKRRATVPPQKISIRFGSAKYSVLIEPERKMERVMRKMAEILGKPMDKLVFKVERSGMVITGKEIMSELVGEVIIVNLRDS